MTTNLLKNIFCSLTLAICCFVINGEEVTILDYYTGKEFNIDEEDAYKYNADIMITYDDNGLWIECNARYAVLDTFSHFTVCPPNLSNGFKRLPGCGSGYFFPVYEHKFFLNDEQYKNLKEVIPTIIEQEFIDIPEFILNSCKFRICPDIPYDENVFYPELTTGMNTFRSEDIVHYKRYISSWICMGQYNPGFKILRAYTHVKLRVDFVREELNTLESNRIDNKTPFSYYDLQGRKVLMPKSGNTYIVRCGSSSKLEIIK